MKDDLVRFGVAMEQSLLADLDALVEARGVTRSEVLRDLVRAEIVRARVGQNVPAVGSLTLVYDHHVRELTERLTELQHRLGDQVRAALHIHLDADRCLEVVVLRGRSAELKTVADRVLATRGVTHGHLEIVTDDAGAQRREHAHGAGEHEHAHKPRAARRKRG